MGTRNLTVVIKDADVKVAQYGQWDGYPSGQGVTILNFLKYNDLNYFSEKLKKVRFITDDKQKEIDIWLASIGSTDGWLTLDQSSKYKAKYPFLSRDHGGGILKEIHSDSSSPDEIIWLHNNISFASDSLMCEYCYVVDLDKMVFECYRGFNKEPLSPDERFQSLPLDEDSNGYFQVKHIKSFDISNLPEEDDFCNQLEPQ